MPNYENSPSNSPDSIRQTADAIKTEVLMKNAVLLVNKSLEQTTHPSLHARIAPNLNQIDFRTSEKELDWMEKVVTESKPQYLKQGLIESGLGPRIISLFFDMDQKTPIRTFWDELKSRIYVANDENRNLRPEQKATAFGLQLINGIFKRAPVTLELPKMPWKEIVRSKMQAFFNSIVGEVDFKDPNFVNFNFDNFLNLLDRMNNLLDDEYTKLIARGAEVYALLPGQDIETSDISIGSVFNEGVISILSRPTKEKFIALMKQNLMFANVDDVNNSLSEAEAKKILDALKPNKYNNNATLTEKEMLLAHFASTVPLHYHGSRNVENPNLGRIVDQWIYPD